MIPDDVVESMRQQGLHEQAAWAERYNSRTAGGQDLKGEIVRAHFPNPRHYSHHLHGALAGILRYHEFCSGNAVEAVWLTGPDARRNTTLHCFEFRFASPIEALAACWDA